VQVPNCGSLGRTGVRQLAMSRTRMAVLEAEFPYGSSDVLRSLLEPAHRASFLVRGPLVVLTGAQ
jgi:hypothetical protein